MFKNKALLDVNRPLLFYLPQTTGPGLGICGINKAVGSGVWTAGGWDNSRRLMPETGDPWV